MKQDITYEEANIAYWTGRAPGYSGVNQEELATAQRRVWSAVLSEQIAAHCGARRPEELRVLDVGTGPGFFAILLAELGYRVTAVDYTASMLREARRNAGPWAEKIRFLEMNAEALDFPDESFDVLISRNLTWNLPHPAAAYRQWNRVLKNGGLLLNFDASWYAYLYNARARSAHLADRANVEKLQVADDTAGTDVDAMEAIARRAPLSQRRRPAWDVAALRSLGMRVRADKGIWKRVWTREERINNASTSMFLIRAVKGAQPCAAARRAVEKRPACPGGAAVAALI